MFEDDEVGAPDLSPLGDATPEEINQALSGQPTPVKPSNTNSTELDLGAFNTNVYNAGKNKLGLYTGYNNRPEDIDKYQTTGWDIGWLSLGGTQGVAENFSYESPFQANKAAAASQTYLDQITNAGAKFVLNTGINAAQGIGMFYGAGEALVTGDLSAIYDNSLSNSLDKVTEATEQRFQLRDKETALSDGMRFTDDVLKGLSFISGAIVTEAALTAASAATLGAAAPVQAAATTGIAARGAKLLKSIATGGQKIISGNIVDDAVKGAALGATTTATQAATALTQAAGQVNRARAINTVGRISRQLLTGAGMEAGMEARTVQATAIADRKAQHEMMYGPGSFTPEMEQQFKEENGQVFDAVFGTNLALVGIGNALLIPRVFGVGLNTGMKTMRTVSKSSLTDSQLNRASQFLNKTVADLPEYIPLNVVSPGRRALAASKYLRSPLYEGFVEEGSQGVISRTAEDYIADKYDAQGNIQAASLYDSFQNGLQQTYSSADGLKEIGMGLLIGTLGLPSFMVGGKFTSKYIGDPDSVTFDIGGKKIPYKAYGGIAGIKAEQVENDDRIRRVMGLMEKDPGTLEILRAESDNVRRQAVLSKQMSGAVDREDFKEAKDIEGDMLFSHASSKIVTGRYDMAVEEAEAIFRDMSVEDYRDFLGQDAALLSDDEVRRRKEDTIRSYTENMARVKDAYAEASKIYRGEDPEVHAGIAKLIYDVKNRDAREKSIADGLANKLKDINGNQILDGLKLQQEFDISIDKVDELTRINQKIKNINKQLETKQARRIIKNVDEAKAAKREAELNKLAEELEALENRKTLIYNALNKFAPKVDAIDVNAEYTYDTDEFTRRLDTLLEMNDLLIRLGNTNTRADYDEIRKLFADLSRIVNDRMALVDAYNSLLEPGGYDKFIASMRSSIEKKITPNINERAEALKDEYQQKEANEEILRDTTPPQDLAEEVPAESGVLVEDIYDFDTANVVLNEQEEVVDVVNFENKDITDILVDEELSDTNIVNPEDADDIDSVYTEDAPETLSPQEPTETQIGGVALVPQPENLVIDNSSPTKVNLSFSLTNATTGELKRDYPVDVLKGFNGKVLELRYIPANGSTLLNEAYGIFYNGQLVTLQNPEWAEANLKSDQITALRNGYKLGIEVSDTQFMVNIVKTRQSVRDALGYAGELDLTANIGYQRKNGLVWRNGIQPGNLEDLQKSSGVRVIALKEQHTPEGQVTARPVTARLKGNKVEITTVQSMVAMFHTAAIFLGQYTPESVGMSQGAYEENLAMLRNMPQFNTDGNAFDQDAGAIADGLKAVFKIYIGNVDFDVDQWAKYKTAAKIANTKQKEDLAQQPPLFAVNVTKGKLVLKTLSKDKTVDTNFPDYFSQDQNPLASWKLNAIRLAMTQLPYDLTNQNLKADFIPNFSVASDGKINRELDTSFDDFVADNFTTDVYAPVYTDPATGKDTRTSVLPSGVTGRIVNRIPTADDVRPTEEVAPKPVLEAAPVFDDTVIDYLDDFDLTELQSIKSPEQVSEEDLTQDIQSMYLVENLSPREVNDAVNILTGSIVTELINTGYNKGVKAKLQGNELVANVRAMLQRHMASTQAMLDNPNISPKQKANFRVIMDSMTRLMEVNTFNKVMRIAMMEVVQNTAGIISITDKTFNDVYDKLSGELEQGIANEDDLQNSDNPTAVFDDNYAFSILPHQATLPQLKMALMTVKNVEIKRDTFTAFGLLKYANYKSLTQDLATNLLGVDYTYPAVISRLKSQSKRRPIFKSVIDLLEGTNVDMTKTDVKDSVKQIQHQFVVFAAKDPSVFISAKIDTKRPDEDAVDSKPRNPFRQFSSNERNMSQFLLGTIASRLYESGLYKYTPGVGITINLQKVQALSKDLDDAFASVTTKGAAAIPERAVAISKVLSKYFKVDVSPSVFDAEVMRGGFADLLVADSQNSSFGVFRNYLKTLIFEKNSNDTRLWTNAKNTEAAEFRKLVRMIGSVSASTIQNSSKDGSGKVRSHISNPKMVTRMTNLFMREEEIGRERDNWLLQNVLNPSGDPDFKKGFSIDYVDGIGQLDSNKELRDFHKMRDIDRKVARFTFFLNNNTYVTTAQGSHPMIRLMLPTLSDKKTMPLINVPMIKEHYPQITSDINDRPVDTYRITDFYNEAAIDNIYEKYVASIVEKERLRILAIRTNATNSLEAMSEQQRKADMFIYFPEMNNILAKNPVPTYEEAHKAAKEAFKKQLNADLQANIKKLDGHFYTLRTVKGKGVRITQPKIINLNEKSVLARLGKKNIPAGFTQAGISALIASMSLHTTVYNGLVFDTYLGDLGQFFKKDLQGTKVNVGKRLAAMIAPGTAIPVTVLPDGTSNEFINYLPLTDFHFSSSYKDYYKSLGLTEAELAAYDLDSTDAAEFVMPQEHLGVLYAQGRITAKEYSDVMDSIKKKRPLTSDQKAYFQPMKPVTAGVNNGKMLYVKSAQIPLVPDAINGTELQKLYDFGLKNNIQRFPFKTAVKIGLENGSVDAFNADGTINVEQLEAGIGLGAPIGATVASKMIVGSRRNMLIQQEVPVSKTNEKTHGSQTAKLFLVNLLNEGGFTLPGSDVTYTGQQLFNQYLNARKEELDLKLQKFADSYGFNYTEGQLQHTGASKKAFAKRIQKEAIERGYDLNEIAHLRIDENGNFITPLWASASQERINSLVLSIYRSEIYDSLMEGFSGPVVPAAGIKELDIKDVSKEDYNNIVWTTDANGNRLFDGNSLKSAKIEGDTFQPDQILLPWKFKGMIDDYIIEKDGRKILDMTRIPKELLQVFSYRIPSQKKASSASLEIVGFLPKSMGDTIIPPSELVGRFGQDFDIDKMFGFMYAHKEVTSKDGVKSIEIVRGGSKVDDKISAARNRMLDIYHSTMRNPNKAVQRAIVSPVTDGYGTELGNMIEESTGSSMKNASLLTMSYNDYKADLARTAKSAIGVFASANVLHSQIQSALKGKKFYLFDSDTFFEIGDDPTSRSIRMQPLGATDIGDKKFLLTYKDKPVAGTISDQLGRLLNHAVDNENNQVLSKLNINELTYDIYQVLTLLGFNQETIALVANHPVTLEYVRRAQSKESITDAGYADKRGVLADLQKELVAKSNLTEEQAYKLASKPRINKSELLEQLGKDYAGVPIEQAVSLINVLLNVDEMGTNLLNFQTAMKLDTRAPKDMHDMHNTIFKSVKRIYGNNAPEWMNRVIDSSVSGSIFSGYRANFIPSLNPDDFLVATGGYRQTYELLFQDRNNPAELMDTVYKGLASHRNTELASLLTGEKISDLRDRLLLNEERNIAKTVADTIAANPKLESNVFLQLLEVNVDKKRGFYTVEFVGDRSSLLSPREVHAAAMELANSNIPEVRKMFKDLVAYALINGGTLGARTFIKYIPADYLSQIPGYQRTLSKVSIKRNEFIQIIQHNPELAAIYPTQVDPYGNRIIVGWELGPLIVRLRNEDGSMMENGSLIYITDYEPDFGRLVIKSYVTVPEIGDYLHSEYDPDVDIITSQKAVINENVTNTVARDITRDVADIDDSTARPEYNDDVQADINSLLNTVETYARRGSEENVKLLTEELRRLGYRGEIPSVATTKNPVLPTTDGNLNTANIPLSNFIDNLPVKSDLLLELANIHEALPDDQKITVRYLDDSISSLQRGVYKKNERTIYVNRNSPDLLTTLTHELVHALSVDAITNPKTEGQKNAYASMKNLHENLIEMMKNEGSALYKAGYRFEEFNKIQDLYNGYRIYMTAMGRPASEQRDATLARFKQAYDEFNEISKTSDAVNKYYPFIYKFYTLSNDYKIGRKEVYGAELMSHILSDKDFIRAMAAIPATKGSMLNKIIETIRKAIQSIFKDDISGTLADELVANSMNIIFEQAGFNTNPITPTNTNSRLDLLNNAMDDTGDILFESIMGTTNIDDLPEDISFDSIKGGPSTVGKRTRELYIQYKKQRVAQLLELKARFAGDAKAANAINERVLQERNELNMIQDDDSVPVEYIISFAERELEDARVLLSKVNVGAGNFEYAQARVQNVLSVLDFYSNVRKLGSGLDTGAMRSLVGEASNLKDDWNRVAASFMREAVARKYPELAQNGYLNPDSFERMENITTISSLFLDSTRQGRVELDYLGSLLKEASINKMNRYNDLMAKYTPLSASFKKSEFYKKYGWEGIVAKDFEGNSTAELLSAFSSEFDKKRREMLDRAKSVGSYRAYYNWLDSNSDILDVTKLFAIRDGGVVRSEDMGYRALLDKKYGKVVAEDIISRQQKLYRDYVNAKLAYEDRVRMENSDPDTVANLVKDYEAKNDPALYYKYKTKELKRPKEGSSGMFVFRVPAKEIGGKATGYYDSRFEELTNDKDAYAYYNFLRENYRDMMSRLPMYSMNQDRGLMQMGLFIPAVKKSLMNSFWSAEGVSGKFNALSDSVIAAMVSKDSELVENLIDPITGQPRKSLPVFFTKRLKDVREQEFDMDRTFAVFSMMAISYDTKNQVEDEVNMVEAVLNNIDVYHNNGLGQRIKSALGVDMTARDADTRSNITRSVKAVVDSFYGRNVSASREGLVFGKKIYTTEEKAKQVEYAAELASAKSRLDAGEISGEEFEKIESDIAAKQEALGGRMDLVKGVRGMTWWTQLKGMAWNIPAAITNSIFGPMSGYRHAAGNQDFTIDEWRQSLGIMMHSSLNGLFLNSGVARTDTAKKIQNMMINLNILKDFTDVQWDPATAGDPANRKLRRKGIQKLAPYELQGSSEYLAYGNSTIAILLNRKVDGKSLWDYMDSNGIIQIDGYRPGEPQFVALVKEIDQVNKLIHGNYDPDAPMPIKKTVLGPLLMQFRTWLPEAAAQRFGGRKYDITLGRETEGTFVTLKNLMLEDWKKTLYDFTRLSLPVMHRFVKIEGLSELEQENLRKSAASMRMYMQIFLLIQLLRALNDDEEDEDAKYMFNFGLNIAGRLERDLRFFTSTESISDVSGQQLLPIFGIAEELGAFGNATIESLMGEPTIETGAYAGDNKMVFHGSKLIPHTKAIQRIYTNSIQEMK